MQTSGFGDTVARLTPDATAFTLTRDWNGVTDVHYDGSRNQTLRLNPTLTASSLTGACITDSVSTTSSSTAASASAAKTLNDTKLSLAGGTMTGALTVPSLGGACITDSVSTTSSTIAASATAVKAANDNAALRVLKAGDTMTGVLQSLNASGATSSYTSFLQLLSGSIGVAGATATFYMKSNNLGIEVSDNVNNIASTKKNIVLCEYGGKVGVGPATTPSGTLDVRGQSIWVGDQSFPTPAPATSTANMVWAGHGNAPVTSSYPCIYHRANIGLGLSSDYEVSMEVNGSTSRAEAMRIKSNGRVGIGTASPQALLHLHSGAGAELKVTSDDNNMTRLGLYEDSAGSTWGSFIQYNGNNAALGDDQLQFGSKRNGSDGVQMVLTATTGRLGIATTAPAYPLDVGGDIHATGTVRSTFLNVTTGGNFIGAQFNSGSSAYTSQVNISGNGTTYLQQYTDGRFYVVNGGTGGVYLGFQASSWTNFSDARLKNIIEPIQDACSKVSTMTPVIFSWKSDPSARRRSGLIAQEVEQVLPEAVEVGKDDMLGVSYSDVLPLALAAIKELSARVTQLEYLLSNK